MPSSPQGPLVYHLFGDAQEPGSLVLSENDLLDFLVAIVAERPPLPSSLIRALKRVGQSFLFVGFGIRHWYLRVLLKVLVRALELHRTGSAIATEPLRGLSDSDREQTILFYQRGTRIELEDTDTSSFLSELAQRLAAEGGFAENAAVAGPRPRAFISYARGRRSRRDGVRRLAEGELRALAGPGRAERRRAVERAYSGRARRHRFRAGALYPALCRKTDSYVNKEITLARERARSVRGPS